MWFKKNKTKNKNWLYFFYSFFIILIPWQIRWIYSTPKLDGGTWEYGTLSIYASMIVLGLTALSFAFSFDLKPYFSKDKFVYLIFLYFFVTSIFSPNPKVSFYYLLIIVGAVLFAHIFRHVPKKLSLLMFVLSGFVQSILALYQFSAQEVVANKWLGMARHLPGTLGDSVVQFADHRILRAYGAFTHPNILGGFLFVSIMIALYLWFEFYKERQAEKWKLNISKGQFLYFIFLIISLSLASFAILASFSRSAVLALLTCVLLLLIFNAKQSNWLAVNVVAKFLVFFVLISMVFNLWVPGAWSSRIKSEGRLEAKSNQERISSWQHFYWEDIDDVLFGQGLGMNSYITYYKNENIKIYQAQPIHNVFVLILAEMGIIGFALLVLLLSRLVIFFKKADINFKIILVGLLIIAMLDHYLWTSWTGLLMLVFVIASLKK